MSNPFVVGFGVKPTQYIPRIAQREEVIQAFNNTAAKTPAYLVVGVRGSGKTVMLDEISGKIGNEWIIININSYSDMLQSLASKLYYHHDLNKLFTQKSFGIDFGGISLSVEEQSPKPDYETIIEIMLSEAQKKSKKVLVVIDEVENSAAMRIFASSFQIFIRDKLPVWLLMAGLPENIYGLTNERKSTFLLRTPRVIMSPLNISMIRNNYRRVLRVSDRDSLNLAQLTQGYCFAYQALGYVCWGRHINTEDESFLDILAEYDYYLQEYSYRKIWEELSENDRKIIAALAALSGSSKVADIRAVVGMSSNQFTVYRERLKRREIISTDTFGVISLSLPRFAEFVNTITPVSML